MSPVALLSSRVFQTVLEGFFRPLARPSAAIYADCADRLERGADEGGRLTLGETLVLIRDVLAGHPKTELAPEEGADTQDLRQRAGKFFNQMLEAGWLEERRPTLDEHWVLLSPNLRPLLRMLRELAEDNVAELKDFAATLRAVCVTLLADGALDPSRLTPEEMRQTVKELIDRVSRATEQMHAVEKLILAFERRQQISPTGEATLRVFYSEFYVGEHIVCYDALQRGGLMPKLNLARAAVQDALVNPFAKERLADGLAAHKHIEPADAYSDAEQMLAALDRALGAIRGKAQIIDGRIADFSRLSAARYRYQTELRGRRPEMVRAWLQAADAAHAGRSFADLAGEPGMRIRAAEVEIHFGREALSRPRRARLPVDLTVTDILPSGDAADAQEFIRRRNLYAITPQRAGRFIERFLPEKGASVSTAEFKLLSEEDDLFDLLAVLAYERGNAPKSHRVMRWRIVQSRAAHGLEPENIPSDIQAGRRVDRFTIERTA